MGSAKRVVVVTTEGDFQRLKEPVALTTPMLSDDGTRPEWIEAPTGVSAGTFDDHSARHENGGADEISIAGLDGTPTELAAHIADTADAHDASAISFTPNGSIAATDVQAAIQEVRDEASGSGIPATIVDAKGDLIAASAADTVARFAVGADGTRLEALASEATGLKWQGFRGVHAYNSANIAIVTATDTVVTLDSERYDTDGFHSTSSNTNRLTVPSGLDGYYLVIFNCDWAAGVAGIREARIRKNVSAVNTYIGIQTVYNASVGDGTRMSVSAIVPLVAGNYVEALVRQVIGVNLNLQAANNYGIELMMTRIGV